MEIIIDDLTREKLKNVSEVFEKTWKQYNEEFGNEDDFEDQLKQFAKSLPQNAIVLDIGCGNGYNAGKLRAYGLNPIGIDSNANMIAAARKEHPDICFKKMDMLDIDKFFDDESFDGVIAFYSLYFLPRTVFESFIEILSSKIKPEGSLLIVNQLGNGEQYVDENLLEMVNENGKNALFTNLYFEQELIDIFLKKGFVLEDKYKIANQSNYEIDGDGRIALRFRKPKLTYTMPEQITRKNVR